MKNSFPRRSKPRHVLPSASGEITSLTTSIGFSFMKDARKSVALQERTNSTTMYPEATRLYEASLKVVELSNPTRAITHNVPPPNPAINQRRMQRYSAAEMGLVRQFEKCQSETSSMDLQIRALKEVTLILGAHARDARERSEKLRGLLADRDMDPVAYESLQRERWIQEHRQDAVIEEAKAVQQQLTILSNGPTQSNVPDRNARTDQEERCRRNLIKFLDESNKRSSVRILQTNSVLAERLQKRKTMDKVSPMCLRTTFSVSRTRFQPLRPMSFDGWTRRSRRISNQPAVAPIIVPPHPLELVSDDGLDEAASAPTETASSFPSIFTAKSCSSSPPSTATTFPISQTTPQDAKAEAEDENGTATILLDTHLSKERYDPKDIDAPLPDYALDLFARFDYDIDIDFSSPPKRHPSADSNPRPNRPQKSAPSSYLQVPPLSPPKHSEHRSPRLGRSSSYRHLGSLFSIPEAISSRIGVNASDKRIHNRDAVLSHSLSKSSLASSSAALEETKSTSLTTKIKKRFSILRLRRPS